MNSKKKVLGVPNSSFLSNVVGRGHSFFSVFKEDHLKKSLGNPSLDVQHSWNCNNGSLQRLRKISTNI